MQTCQIHPNPTNEWTPVVRLSLTPYPTLFQQAVKLSQAAVRLMEGLASGLRVRPLRSPAPPWLGLNQGFVARVTGGYVDTTKIKITKVGFLLLPSLPFIHRSLLEVLLCPFCSSSFDPSWFGVDAIFPAACRNWLWATRFGLFRCQNYPALGVHTHTWQRLRKSKASHWRPSQPTSV